MAASGRHRRPQGQRAAGPPDPRPAGRLQGQPDPLAQHQDRPVRRPGPDRGPPAHRRARARHPRLHAAGVLEHRGAAAPRTARPSRPRSPRSDGHKPQLHSAEDGAGGGRRGAERCRSSSPRSRSAAPEEPGRAVHHQHAPAGSRQEARLLLPAHHAGGAGPVRGHGRRRGRSGRPHHLHADRLGARVRRGHRLGARVHREELRQALPARVAQRLQLAARTPGSRTPTRPSGRPTSRRRPEQVQKYLEPDQFRLYQLIWQRFVASQMTPAVYDMTIVDFDLGRYLFRATGSRARLRRLPRALYGRAREGRGEDDGRPAAHPAARRGATRSRSGRSPRRSTSPSRRPGSPRPAW